MKHAESFKDLVVYQKAREVAREVFKITQSFPKEEMYSLTDQVRRSSRSIGAQIAEAWGKRRYEKHFISKMTDAYAFPPIFFAFHYTDFNDDRFA